MEQMGFDAHVEYTDKSIAEQIANIARLCEETKH